jgi:hypothetical protein
MYTSELQDASCPHVELTLYERNGRLVFTKEREESIREVIGGLALAIVHNQVTGLVLRAASDQVDPLCVSGTGTRIKVLDAAVTDSKEAFDSCLHRCRGARSGWIDTLFAAFRDQDGIDGVHQLLYQCGDGGTLLVANDSAVVGDVPIWPPHRSVIPKPAVLQRDDYFLLGLGFEETKTQVSVTDCHGRFLLPLRWGIPCPETRARRSALLQQGR